ncbi:MAG: DUF3179 domain-containing protein [Gemmatimonadota bacterium]|nr:DUF3179 domain-containing protein [Gemmatimonadota bacterium]MDH3421465.1 DUF3179 domain-containing protein [Gemmatimonadota bacterium]
MRTLQLALVLVGLAACHVESPINLQDPGEGTRYDSCDLNIDFLIVATARDGVQALDDARWVDVSEAEVPGYLNPDTRVIGVQTFGQSYAIPLNLLWYHEIVNLSPGGPLGPQIAITYCPLTGSSLVFDRTAIGGARLGVSGLLFMNNLVLFDRSTGESLWPQMLAEARCGVQTGTRLGQHPFVEMQWSEWLSLHPDTRVLDGDQGYDPIRFDYLLYPYGVYRETEAFWRAATTMPPLDRRRFSKERVVGVPSSTAGQTIAFPFGALTDLDGTYQAVDFALEGAPALVLWSDDAQGGYAYRPETEDGTPVTLLSTTSGFEDVETGSTWTVEGEAVAGPMAGARLVALERTHTAFWGAWAAFNPDTRLWE